MSFIKLDRKMLSWGWRDSPNTLALWVNILLQANWEDREWHGQVYERGTFPTSLAKLSQLTGLSVQEVRTCLNRLKSTGEITVQSTNKGMKINVEKWAEYQGLDEYINTQNNKRSNTRATRNQHESNTQSTTLKEIKEIEEVKEDKNNYAPSPNELKAVAKLPLNEKDTYYHVTEEDVHYYQELYPAVDVMQEIRKMVGWLDANPEKRKTKRGIKKFMNHWLSGEQDRGRRTETKKGGFTFFDIDGDLPSLE